MSFNAILKPATSATYSMGYQRFHTWIPYIHRIPSSHEIFLEVSATKGYPQSSSSFWLDVPWNKPSSLGYHHDKQETSIVMWISNLVGGFNLSLRKIMEFVSWDDEIPKVWKVIQNSMETSHHQAASHFLNFSPKFQTGELRACSFTR